MSEVERQTLTDTADTAATGRFKRARGELGIGVYTIGIPTK
jgi:hypothetical protein